MIGKTTNAGKSFKPILYYCLSEKKHSEILDMNGLSRQDPKGLIKEFEAIREGNLDVSKPVWHTSLSFDVKDQITNEKMTEIANRFLEKAGFSKDNNQFIIIKHNDRAHTHCHIVANRIGVDGKTVSDYYSKSNTVKWAKELENEYHLVKVQDIAAERRKAKEISQPKDLTKEQLKEAIDKAIKDPNIKTLQDVAEKLEKQGIQMQILTHANTGKGYGVNFKVKETIYKGSDLGKKYAFKALSNLLPPEIKIMKTVTQTITKEFDLEI